MASPGWGAPASPWSPAERGAGGLRRAAQRAPPPRLQQTGRNCASSSMWRPVGGAATTPRARPPVSGFAVRDEGPGGRRALQGRALALTTAGFTAFWPYPNHARPRFRELVHLVACRRRADVLPAPPRGPCWKSARRRRAGPRHAPAAALAPRGLLLPPHRRCHFQPRWAAESWFTSWERCTLRARRTSSCTGLGLLTAPLRSPFLSAIAPSGCGKARSGLRRRPPGGLAAGRSSACSARAALLFTRARPPPRPGRPRSRPRGGLAPRPAGGP